MPMLIRLSLSACLVAAVFRETGPCTAIAIALLTISLECQSYALRIIALEKLEKINELMEDLFKPKGSDKINKL